MSGRSSSSNTGLFDFILNNTAAKPKQPVDMMSLVAEAQSTKKARVAKSQSEVDSMQSPQPKARLNRKLFPAMAHSDEESLSETDENAEPTVGAPHTPVAPVASGDIFFPRSPTSPSCHMSDLFSPVSSHENVFGAALLLAEPDLLSGGANEDALATTPPAGAAEDAPKTTPPGGAAEDTPKATGDMAAALAQPIMGFPLPGAKELQSRLDNMPKLPTMSDGTTWGAARAMLKKARFRVDSILIWGRLEKRNLKNGSWFATVSLRKGPLNSAKVLCSTTVPSTPNEPDDSHVLQVCQALAETMHFCKGMHGSIESKTVEEAAMFDQFADLAGVAFRVTAARWHQATPRV